MLEKNKIKIKYKIICIQIPDLKQNSEILSEIMRRNFLKSYNMALAKGGAEKMSRMIPGYSNWDQVNKCLILNQVDRYLTPHPGPKNKRNQEKLFRANSFTA